jgi:hypothetical protein
VPTISTFGRISSFASNDKSKNSTNVNEDKLTLLTVERSGLELLEPFVLVTAHGISRL